MPKDIEKQIIVSLEVQPQPTAKRAFIEWQAKFNTIITAFPGFVSLEFLAPTSTPPVWKIVQRFATYHLTENWLQAPIRRELIQELKKIALDQDVQEVAAEESYAHNGITEMFLANVAPEQEDAFRRWTAKIHQTEAHFPGFRGVYVQSPSEGYRGHWITLLQFDSIENLDGWLQSLERQQLLQEAAPYIVSMQVNRFISPYSGWFSSIAQAGGIPAAWKQSMVVLLVLFPVVMLESKFLFPWLKEMNQTLAMFISNALSVGLLAYPLMPQVNRALEWWLLPKGIQRSQKDFLGVLLIVTLYALSIALFW